MAVKKLMLTDGLEKPMSASQFLTGLAAYFLMAYGTRNDMTSLAMLAKIAKYVEELEHEVVELNDYIEQLEEELDRDDSIQTD